MKKMLTDKEIRGIVNFCSGSAAQLRTAFDTLFCSYRIAITIFHTVFYG
jgi:hypothetical protein